VATKSATDSSVPQLRLKIDNKGPVSASDLGDLLKAIADDCRSLSDNSRTLVVSSVEGGSIIVTLMDAMALAAVAKPYAEALVEFARGSKAIFDFVDKLKKAFARNEESEKELWHRYFKHHS
jgi:hypothetical protein